jgi:hypothetical protein
MMTESGVCEFVFLIWEVLENMFGASCNELFAFIKNRPKIGPKKAQNRVFFRAKLEAKLSHF